MYIVIPSIYIYLLLLSAYWLGHAINLLRQSCCKNLQITTSPSAHTWARLIFFDSTQSQKVLIRLNSWLTMALEKLIEISSRLKMDFWNLIEIESRLKSFKNTLIQVNSRLKKLSGILIQIDSLLKNYLEYWFESSRDSTIRINCWFRWPFWAFTQFGWTSPNFVDLFGLPLNFVDLFGHSTQVP